MSRMERVNTDRGCSPGAAYRPGRQCRTAASGQSSLLAPNSAFIPPFLIDSAARLEIAATPTQQTTKLFLIETETATFRALAGSIFQTAHRNCRVAHSFEPSPNFARPSTRLTPGNTAVILHAQLPRRAPSSLRIGPSERNVVPPESP